MLRVVLAFAVVYRHCFPLVYGMEEATHLGIWWTATMAIVPIFFILSGFLVTGSAVRLTLGKFVASRVLRIIPALAVDTLVTILVIGALFTTLSHYDYFTSEQTLSYFWNIFGFIHYLLPGVFEQNPHAGIVNGSLWTIPPELGCYVMMSFIIILGWVSDWVKTLAIAVFSSAAIVAAPYLPEQTPGFIMKALTNPGAILVPEFLFGSVLYTKRHAVPYSWTLFAIAIGCVILSGVLLPDEVYSVMPVSTVVLIPAYAYIAVFIGVTKLPKPPLFSRGDYSYGVYLYGFPIQQAIVASTGVTSPYALFAMAVVPITLLAMFSWHVVEKPTLKLRKGFSFAAKMERQRQQELDKS
ncbi:acyltransferase family protein [Pseudoblastomonas halimionae]|uniref:Acyltransferase family protein n=1 Tax=Alteriqipengyuania halimionae TaxID=1926630 RepID=A0A6I4U8S2_9SPHN|nr:acyltransferase [Alteriqipengyuania halimionae]MXP11205.1 acyltransferase family protein [Alteriqipengyuania halimionae]